MGLRSFAGSHGLCMTDWQTENLVPFGRYFLGARIATGGMGEVYLGKMKGAAGFEKRVVIKKILPQLSRDPEFVKRFIDEGKLAVKLSHANIVPVLDLGEVDGDYFLAMEYVDGADLRQVLRLLAAEERTLPLDLAIVVLAEICRGLHYAHRRTDDAGRPLHIIHRDISPANVMVSRDGAVQLVDFGIAKAADRMAHSVTGALQGKFAYMSPEQARGDALDCRSDLFALGSVAYELLTGARPFEGRTDLQTLEKVKRADPTPIQELRPDLPEPIAAAIHICLAHDPSDRFESVEGFQHVLQDHLFDLPSPPGEKEIGAFVRDLVGARPTPAVRTRGRSIDELLSDELDRASRGSRSGVEATSTATVDGAPRRTPTAGAGPNGQAVSTTGTVSQPGMGASNRAIIAGLVVIIGVLLYFNIRSLLDERPVEPPVITTGGVARDATPATGELLPPVPGSDVRDAVHAVAAAAPSDATGSDRAGVPDGEDDADAAPPSDTPESVPLEPARNVRLEGLQEGDEVRVNDELVRPDETGRVPLPSRVEARILVERPHHVAFEYTVSADASDPPSVAVDVRPQRKTVLVKSSPDGAKLAVDGKDSGKAPQRVTVSYGRTVRVDATLPGHAPQRETIRYGGPSTVVLTLEPNPTGRVFFRFFPASAKVFIDGHRVATGSTNLVNEELPAGPHRLVIRAPEGGGEKRVPFDVKAGRTTNLETLKVGGP